jgi:hypothetical protein
LTAGFLSQHNIFRDLWFKKQIITLKSWEICKRYLGEFQGVFGERHTNFSFRVISMTSSSITHVLRWMHKDTVNFFAAHLMTVTLYAPYEKWIGLVKGIHEAMQ